MLVIVTRLSIMPTMAITEAAPLLPDRAEPTVWRGDEQRAAPLSIVVSTADREVRVIRAGKEIGAAPVTFTSDVPGPVAFQRQADGRWLRLLLPGQQHVEGPELGQDAIQVDPVCQSASKRDPLSACKRDPLSLSSVTGMTGAPFALVVA
jgi:hypothetical protein